MRLRVVAGALLYALAACGGAFDSQSVANSPETAPGAENHANALLLLHNAVSAQQAGDIPEAMRLYSASVELQPTLWDAHANLALLYAEQYGSWRADAGVNAAETEEMRVCREAAWAHALKCGEVAGNSVVKVAQAHYTTAAVVEATAEPSTRRTALLQARLYMEETVRLMPAFVPAWWNLARLRRMLGDRQGARNASMTAFTIRPEDPDVLFEVASDYFVEEAFGQAATVFLQVHNMTKDGTSLHHNAAVDAGRSLMLDGQFERALSTFEALLGTFNGSGGWAEKEAMLQLRRFTWSWKDLYELERDVVMSCLVQNGDAIRTDAIVYDLSLTEASMPMIAAAAVGAAQEMDAVVPPSRQFAPLVEPRKLRVAYSSFEFKEHPTAYLIRGVLRTHSRDRVHVLCYHYGPVFLRNVTPGDVAVGFVSSADWETAVSGPPATLAVARACDVFRLVAADTDEQIAEWIYRDGADIHVDLMGLSAGGRPTINSFTPAPIVVNYLAYLGTTGSSKFHYAIVDPVVVPVEARGWLTESRVYLPHTYQVNDYELTAQVCDTDTCRVVARTVAGLPLSLDVVVFADFNASYKSEPAIFGVWMEILSRVSNSVLWLLKSAKWSMEAQARVLGEAASRGVSPSRLLFAPTINHDAHLARYSAIDVFLDTRIYGAHTTAADTLWAAVPVVTLERMAFQSRGAASLLRALGRPDLIASSLKEYADLAVRLGLRANLLRAEQGVILHALLTSAAFDTSRVTHNLERAYSIMAENSLVSGPNSSLSHARFHVVVNPIARRYPVVRVSSFVKSNGAGNKVHGFHAPELYDFEVRTAVRGFEARLDVGTEFVMKIDGPARNAVLPVLSRMCAAVRDGFDLRAKSLTVSKAYVSAANDDSVLRAADLCNARLSPNDQL